MSSLFVDYCYIETVYILQFQLNHFDHQHHLHHQHHLNHQHHLDYQQHLLNHQHHLDCTSSINSTTSITPINNTTSINNTTLINNITTTTTYLLLAVVKPTSLWWIMVSVVLKLVMSEYLTKINESSKRVNINNTPSFHFQHLLISKKKEKEASKIMVVYIQISWISFIYNKYHRKIIP